MDNHDTESSRASSFVTATGFVFQLVGGIYVLGGCCLWSVSGLLQAELSQPIHGVGDYFRAAPLAGVIVMVDVVTTFLGGLGLAVTGLGLQSQRPRSGIAALVFTALLDLVWCASAVGYAWSGLYWKMLGAIVFSMINMVLFLLAGNCVRLLKLHPPSPESNVVTDEFLRQYRQPREH